MRKLASIQIIDKLTPIEDADLIEVASVLGWNVVVKKGDFKPGDLCVFFEIDSVLPDVGEFRFLEKKRLRTKKLRGVMSQGLAVKISDLTYYKEKSNDDLISMPVGTDVSELLNVHKYENIEFSIRGNIFGPFPFFVPTTDEVRIQSEPGLLKEIENQEVYISTKYDGTSFTSYYFDNRVGVCSRSVEYKNDESNDGNLYVQIFRKYDLENKLKSLGNHLAIQGEICGPKVQKNRLSLPDLNLFVFDIYDIDQKKYMDLNDMIHICKDFELNTVFIENVAIFDSSWNIPTLLKMSNGVYPDTITQREGIVIRPIKTTFSKILQGRLSFKVINNNYLLKYE